MTRSASGPSFTPSSVAPSKLCAGVGQVRDPADLPARISQSALEHRCPLCVEALDIFVAAYGAEAGNLALRTSRPPASTSAAGSRRRSSPRSSPERSSTPSARRADARSRRDDARVGDPQSGCGPGRRRGPRDRGLRRGVTASRRRALRRYNPPFPEEDPRCTCVVLAFSLSCVALRRSRSRLCPADRIDQRKGCRHGRRRASRRHRRSPLRRSARPARDRQRVRTASTQLPALPPGQLHGDVHALRHADRDAEGAGPALAGHRRRRGARRPGRVGDRHRHGVGDAHRQGVGVDQERPLERADQRSAGRAGISRSDQADPGGAVHAGPDARPERRRQRPGQRLPVRRRQRDAAALRHALGGAGVARHRADHGHQGRRARGRLRSLGRLLDRLGQQVGHEPVHRPGQLPAPDREHGGRPHERRAVAVPGGPQLARCERRRPDPQGPPVLLRLVLPAREHAEQRARTCTALCRSTRARATKASAS